MAVFNKSLLLTMAVLAVVVGLTEAQGVPSCASKLVPCASFINSKNKPDSDCCSNITNAVKNELPCLCALYTSPGLLETFNVTVDEALRISKECNAPTDLSACNITASSPTTSVPPPGVPGNDASGLGGVAWTGIASLLLFLASMLIY